MSSEIALLRERLLLEGQAVYRGLYGYGDVAKHVVIRQRHQQMSQTIAQLEPHIGVEAVDEIVAESMELAAQKEQQLKARRRESQRRARLKRQKKI